MLRVQGLGFRVENLGVRGWELGLRVEGFGLRVEGSGFKVQGVGCMAWGVPCRSCMALRSTSPTAPASRANTSASYAYDVSRFKNYFAKM